MRTSQMVDLWSQVLECMSEYRVEPDLQQVGEMVQDSYYGYCSRYVSEKLCCGLR